jgi:hypothetical protein
MVVEKERLARRIALGEAEWMLIPLPDPLIEVVAIICEDGMLLRGHLVATRGRMASKKFSI